MKIKKITFDNFRVYNTPEGNPYTIDINTDKPIVLLYGNNGFGKTSFFDGIEWAIKGSIERYQESNAEKKDYKFLKNLLSTRDSGYVELELDNFDKPIKRVIQTKGSTDYNEGKLVGINSHDLKSIFIDDKFKEIIKIEDEFNVSHLLSQDLIDSFIKSKKEGDRYTTFIKLYGLHTEDIKQNKFKTRAKDLDSNIKDLTSKINKRNDNLSLLNSQITDISKAINQSILEDNLKSYFKEETINQKNIFFLKSNLASKDLNNNLELSKLNREKILIAKEDFFKKLNLELEGLIKRKKDLLIILPLLERKKHLESIDKKKEEYIDYLSKKETETALVQEKKELEIKIFSLSNILKDESQIITYCKTLEKVKVDSYIENLKETKSIEQYIMDKEKFIKEFGQLNERFLIASSELLKSSDFESCPLCGNKEYSNTAVISELHKKIESESSPIILEYKEDIDNLKKDITALKLINKEIIDSLGIILREKINKKTEKVSGIEKALLSINNYLDSYTSVSNSLQFLNITFEDFIPEKNRVFELLKDNSLSSEQIKSEVSTINNKIQDIKSNRNDLNDFEKLKSEGISLLLVEQKIELLEKELSAIKKITEDIYSLEKIYNENENLLKIKEIENERNHLITKKNRLKIAQDDFIALGKHFDDVILNSVKNKSKQYKEKIQIIYNLLNPHLNFNELNIEVGETRAGWKNSLRLELPLPGSNVVANPTYIFSSAQTNLLAIAVFLTFALDTKWSNLETIFLDDPIQNMDDINIYAFTDLIRKISEKKQVFFSTHDDRIKDFIMMKMGKDKVQLVEFEGYGKIKK